MQRYDEMRVHCMQRVDRLPMAYAQVDSRRGDSRVEYLQQIVNYLTDTLVFIILMIIIIILHFFVFYPSLNLKIPNYILLFLFKFLFN